MHNRTSLVTIETILFLFALLASSAVAQLSMNVINYLGKLPYKPILSTALNRGETEMKFNMMMASCIGLLLLLTVPTVTHATVPLEISYQGYLTGSDGNPVPNGEYDMIFAIYELPTGGNQLWVMPQTVTIANGVYNVILDIGYNLPPPPEFFDRDLYLGVTVGTDAEMTPRQKFTSTPYAMKAAVAENADTLDGIDSTELDQSAHVARTDNPHSVTAAQTGAASLSDITWGNLSNVPAGFADSVDDIGGITTETDPTVPDSVKDGVSWDELSDIPSGFADDIDNVGMTTSLDYGRSGVASNLYEGSTTLTNKYVNQLGDNMTGRLAASFSPYDTGWNEAIKGSLLGSSAVGAGVYGYTESDNAHGVYGGTIGTSGIAVYGEAMGAYGRGVNGFASNTGSYMNYGGYFTAAGRYGRGIEAIATATESTNHGGVFTAEGLTGRGVYGIATGVSGTGVKGAATNTGAVTNYGGYFIAAGEYGVGIYVDGGSRGYAGVFRGNILILSEDTGASVMEFGEGLDYAEGFDISEVIKVAPGSVLIIDPDNPGKLKLSDSPYDTKVAGIVAGGKGLGSGVRLGAGQFDNDVALAGRVFCNVDATYGGVSPGDLLTSSPNPGYAMKVEDYNKAQGAILGKAMQRLEKGQKEQILVLVTLQ